MNASASISASDPRMSARVLVVAPYVVASFTRQDARLLDGLFEVELFPYKNGCDILKLGRLIRWADLVLVWFAGRHSLPAAVFALLANRPIVVIIGGYEVAWVPEIQYGVRPGSLRHRFVHWILSRSRRILTVSKHSTAALLSAWPQFQGKNTMIYNGVDVEKFGFSTQTRNNNILSVGIINASTLETKGWKLYWETAAAMPDVSFLAVGPAADATAIEFVRKGPPNLRWLGPLYDEDLVREYQRASVYFQGSRHESFSLSLAESMACGCIPVVTRAGALPEVAGDVGFYLKDRTAASAVTAVRTALAAPEISRQRARARIESNFTAARRGELLRAELIAVLEASRSRYCPRP